MLNCKVLAIPLNINEKLRLEDGKMVNTKLFRSLIGGLVYLTHTQLDIIFSISVVFRFIHNPTKHHFGATK